MTQQRSVRIGFKCRDCHRRVTVLRSSELGPRFVTDCLMTKEFFHARCACRFLRQIGSSSCKFSFENPCLSVFGLHLSWSIHSAEKTTEVSRQCDDDYRQMAGRCFTALSGVGWRADGAAAIPLVTMEHPRVLNGSTPAGSTAVARVSSACGLPTWRHRRQ